MKIKKIPLRSCIVTKERLSKYELLRVVKTNDNSIVIDQTGKINGHGVYLKKDLEVIEIAKRRNILSHVFDGSIPNDIYDKLTLIINGGEEK